VSAIGLAPSAHSFRAKPEAFSGLGELQSKSALVVVEIREIGNQEVDSGRFPRNPTRYAGLLEGHFG
jgi:hypothetical protein